MTPHLAALEARLDRFGDVVESRTALDRRETTNVMLGGLAALVDDETWDEALKRVEQVTK